MKIPFISCFLFCLLLSGCYGKPYTKPNNPQKPNILTQPEEKPQRGLLSFSVKQGLNTQVIAQDGSLYVQINQQLKQSLEAIYYPLFNHYARIYVKSKDYNQDGYRDLAVLSSISSVGTNACYRIYQYQPQSRRFILSQPATRCGS